MVRVGVAFAPGRGTDGPNVKDSDTTGVYYRNIIATLSSARRWNPDVEIFLATTVVPPAAVGTALASIAVSTELIPFQRAAPPDFSSRFAASLYFLDVLQSRSCADGALLIDPDCPVVRPLPALPEQAVAVHFLGYRSDEQVNGLSATEAEAWHRDLFGREPGTVYRHVGGEAVWVPAQLVPRLSAVLDDGLELALRRHREGRSPWPTTEEHLLTAAARVMPFVESGLVRRIWTARHHRTAMPADLDLVMWHVPAEKDRGMLALADAAERTSGWFWQQDTPGWHQRAARMLGIVPSLRRRVEHGVARRVRRS